MQGDIIKCSTCGKIFIDTTKRTDKLSKAGNTYQWKGQDSREGNYKNMCPFCYSTCTDNTHKSAKKKRKFIYQGNHKDGGTKNVKCTKRIKKPNMNTEHIADETLGVRQSCDVSEAPYNFAPSNERTLPRAETNTEDFVTNTGGTYNVQHTKAFTPIELMERKMKAQYAELLSSPDNRGKYRGWRYDKRLKK